MRRFSITLLIVVTLAFMSTSSAFCQANISADSIKNMLVKDWQRGKAYTQDYLKAMPTSKFSFKAMDSVRTFGQQLLHISEATMWLVSTATGEKMPNIGENLDKRTTAQSADSVLYYVNSSYDFAINAIIKLSAGSFMQPVTVNMGEAVSASRLGWLLKAFEHQTHHRGQTTIYLRLAGVKPPDERLF